MVSRFGGSCEVGVLLNVLEWVWSVVLNCVAWVWWVITVFHLEGGSPLPLNCSE